MRSLSLAAFKNELIEGDQQSTDYDSGGQEFESLRARQIDQQFQ
jgi:hypothetical protein